jgi:hypothetical protein
MSSTLPTATPPTGVLHHPITGLPTTKLSDAARLFDGAAGQYRIISAYPENKEPEGTVHPGYWALNKFCEQARDALQKEAREFAAKNNKADHERRQVGTVLTQQEIVNLRRTRLAEEKSILEPIVNEWKDTLEEMRRELGL